MKEITVTFENGGVFNGSANSFTLDNLTTYYFAIDKNYRVQVNANTMAIELQEYQNTNGAWYPITIITSVTVAEIENKDMVTKEYLENNYYTKAQTDNKYVLKTGDTMTGILAFKFNDNDDYLTISDHTINFRTPDNKYYMQIYRNAIHIYNGNVMMHDTTELNSATLTRITKNGLYIYDNQNKRIGSFSQENNRAYTAMHIFNSGRIVMHTGEASTTEEFMQISGANFNLYNATDTGAIRLNAAVIISKLTTTEQLNAQGANYFNGLVVRDNYGIRVGEGTNYNFISSGTISIFANSNTYMTLLPGGCHIYVSGQKACEFSNNRGVELYGGKALILHNDYNISGKHTTYNWNNMTIYNFSSSDEWTFWLNAATVNWYCQRFLAYATSTARIQSSGADAELAGNAGTITANNAPKALNNEFFSNNFLNALNLFLEYMQDNIKSSVPNYSKVNEIRFNSETFGGGFQAGGGSSRGGGVGRRSIG